MLSPITTDMVLVDLGNGSTVEYTNELLEELRRLAVAGFTAFARGGLEIGGVLYGHRDGTRLTIHGFAEFATEHARGPGFLLSEKDRPGFAQLVEAPAGLETIGWYRAHTRGSLQLDGGDRELFDAFPGEEPIAGLVLKPVQWGPSAGAFYIREASGGVVPDAPREFAIKPPERPQQPSHPVEAPEAASAAPIAESIPEPEPLPPLEAPPRLRTQLVPVFTPRETRLGIAIAAVLVLLAAVGLTIFVRSRHPRELGLQAYAVAPGQLRINWNRNSLPVMDGASGMIEIHDGDFDTRIPLSAEQLQLNGLTYTQKTEHVAINLRVDSRRSYKPASDETIEFVGPVQAGVPPVEAAPAAAETANPGVATRRSTEAEPVETKSRSFSPIRPFKPPVPHKNAPAPPVSLLPTAPPSVPVTPTPQAALPEVLAKAPVVPRPSVTQPAVTQSAATPHTGRLIWTGKLRRHEIVEIAGASATIGTLSGLLNGTPAEFRVLPAEFTKDGLSVYTPDGKMHGRTEPPSVWNGWNAVTYQFDPVRVKELVVLEAPSKLNGYKRLTLRCDSRTCPVVVVDWTGK